MPPAFPGCGIRHLLWAGNFARSRLSGGSFGPERAIVLGTAG